MPNREYLILLENRDKIMRERDAACSRIDDLERYAAQLASGDNRGNPATEYMQRCERGHLLDEGPRGKREALHNARAPRARIAAMIADLEMVVGTLSGTLDGLREECEKHGAEFTKEQEARWEGGFMALRAVLADDLRPMLEAWKAGGQFSREGERIARTGEYAPVTAAAHGIKPSDLLEMNERGEAS